MEVVAGQNPAETAVRFETGRRRASATKPNPRRVRYLRRVLNRPGRQGMARDLARRQDRRAEGQGRSAMGDGGAGLPAVRGRNFDCPRRAVIFTANGK